MYAVPDITSVISEIFNCLEYSAKLLAIVPKAPMATAATGVCLIHKQDVSNSKQLQISEIISSELQKRAILGPVYILHSSNHQPSI